MSMKFVDKIENKIEKDLTLRTLEKAALIFLIVWLFIQTSSFWLGIISTVWKVIQPFIIAFVIAFILCGPVHYGEKHHVNRKVTIAVIYVTVFLLLFWLIYSLVPMFITRSGSLISSLISGLKWVENTIAGVSSSGTPEWFTELINQATSALSDVRNLLPDLNSSVSDMLSEVTNTAVVIIFSIVISVFMSSGWEKIRDQIIYIAKSISNQTYVDVMSVNHEVKSYLHSLFILMAIHLFEYMLVYFIVGHPNWLILGVATSLSLLIPYLGPTVVNVIGIVTALTLSPIRVIILIALIVVLSFVDEYVIAPLVHSHNTAVTPLWALFSVFAGGELCGTVGIVIAIPVFLSLRIIVLNHRKTHKQQKAAVSEGKA